MFFSELFSPELELLRESNKSILELEDPDLEKFIFINDLVLSEKPFYYLGVPKFGSLLAIKIKVPEKMESSVFIEYIKEYEMFLLEEKKKLEAAAEWREEYLSKLQELQLADAETDELELENEKKIAEFSEISSLQPNNSITFKNKIFVLDTFGQEDPASLEQIKKSIKAILQIEKNWLEVHINKLQKNALYFINYKEKEKPSITELEELLTSKIGSGIEDYKNEITDQQYPEELLEAYLKKQESKIKFDFWIDQLKNVESDLLEIKNCENLPFQDIIESTLFLIKYLKNDVYISKTNLLNWRSVREIQLPTIISLFTEMNPDSACTENPIEYSRPVSVLGRIEKYLPEDLHQNFYPFYLLYEILKSWMELRKEVKNKEVLMTQHLIEKRESQIQAEKERIEKRDLELEEAKNKFYEDLANREEIEHEENTAQEINKENKTEEGNDEQPPTEEESAEVKKSEEFNSEEWISNWEISNPRIEIIDEPIVKLFKDIDDVTEEVEKVETQPETSN